MKRHSMIVCGLAVVLGLTGLSGCGSTQQRTARLTSTERIALGDLGPANHGEFTLGAGDALGQAIFANYITVARAASPELDEVYASGETNNGD